MRRLLGSLALLTALGGLLAGSACGAATPYAATVNGSEISQEELDRELDAIRDNRDYRRILDEAGREWQGKGQGTFSTAFVAELLTRQVLFELVHQEVLKRRLAVTAYDRQVARDALIQSIGSKWAFERFHRRYQEDLVLRSAEVSVLQADVADVDVSQDAVERYYEENRTPLYVETCASHILVETTEKAAELHARLVEGADFARLATESKDTGSARRGGQLECVTGRGNFVPEFEDAMEKLAVGQLSEPVQTQFGFHLIKVNARRPRALSAVRAEIRSELLAPAQAEFGELMDEKVDAARVRVNPRYGRFEKGREGSPPGVVPPEAPAAGTTSTTAPGLVPSPAPGAPSRP